MYQHLQNKLVSVCEREKTMNTFMNYGEVFTILSNDNLCKKSFLP